MTLNAAPEQQLALAPPAPSAAVAVTFAPALPLSAQHVLALQRSAGNAATTRWLAQASLGRRNEPAAPSRLAPSDDGRGTNAPTTLDASALEGARAGELAERIDAGAREPLEGAGSPDRGHARQRARGVLARDPRAQPNEAQRPLDVELIPVVHATVTPSGIDVRSELAPTAGLRIVTGNPVTARHVAYEIVRADIAPFRPRTIVRVVKTADVVVHTFGAALTGGLPFNYEVFEVADPSDVPVQGTPVTAAGRRVTVPAVLFDDPEAVATGAMLATLGAIAVVSAVPLAIALAAAVTAGMTAAEGALLASAPGRGVWLLAVQPSGPTVILSELAVGATFQMWQAGGPLPFLQHRLTTPEGAAQTIVDLITFRSAVGPGRGGAGSAPDQSIPSVHADVDAQVVNQTGQRTTFRVTAVRRVPRLAAPGRPPTTGGPPIAQHDHESLGSVGAPGSRPAPANPQATPSTRTRAVLLGSADAANRAVQQGWIRPLAGFVDMIVHADPSGRFRVQHNGSWVNLDQRSIARYMRTTGYRGGPVRLISCFSGSRAHRLAQHVANSLGTRVLAPSDELWTRSDGQLYVGPNSWTNSGSWIAYSPQGQQPSLPLPYSASARNLRP